MQALHETVRRVAPADVNVLVLGETGAGKDVVATLLHAFSGRAARSLVTINCACLSENMLESELFGYERGAFTGAVSPKPGLLEEADGGTLFLDELGELAPRLQAKLLRAIDTGSVTRLGAVRPRAVDVRFVAATNHDLEADVANGRFRRDLFYRLNGVSFVVPPLRERPGDVEPLALAFLQAACRRFGVPERRLSLEALGVLLAHSWPGNVRELKHVLERAALLATTPVIRSSDLGLARRAAESGQFAAIQAPSSEPETSVAQSEIAQALAACGGNQSRAAKLLGISRRTIVRRIAESSMPRPRAPSARASGSTVPPAGVTTDAPTPEAVPTDAPRAESETPACARASARSCG
jgi:two-component system response regulator AtoC